MPASGGIELGDACFADLMRRLHSPSQSQAVYTTEYGIAYVEKQHTGYPARAVRRILTRSLNIYLLITFNQMRTLDLSRRFAALARDLRSTTNKLGEDGVSVKETQLDRLTNRVLALDVETTAFLASEWWTDVTPHSQAGQILVWMQETTGLDHLTSQVVQQAWAIRESIQTLIEYREHPTVLERQKIELERQKTEQEQHYTSQMMEWVIGILTFIGMPLAILLEVWISWDLTTSFTAGSGPPWLVWLILVILGVIGIGMVSALVFGVRLWRPPRRH